MTTDDDWKKDDWEYKPPRLWRATDLKPAAQPRHLAKGRLIRAAINLLVGDEGIGKSLLWVWIVAAITTGRALPEFGIPARRPQHVIVIVTEDGWTDTVLPRCEVAGVDLDYLSVICTEDDGSGAPAFPNDMHLIYDSGLDPALILVDAWLDTVPSGLSVKDPQQARRALHPWKEVATVTDAAVLLLTHTNRVDSGNARDKYGATGELRKKARLTLFAQQDDDGNLVVGVEKANTTTALPASMFMVTPIQHFPATDDHDGTVPLLRFIGESDRTARDHIVDTHDGQAGSATTVEQAAEWLRGYLDANGPAADSARAKKAASDGGVSERTLQRARKKLGVVIGYTDKGTSTWSLPTQGGEVVDGEVVETRDTPVPPTPDTPLPGTSPKSGTSPGHGPMPTPVPETPTRAYANPEQQGSGGTGPRPTACRDCHITLPATATTDLCEDCAEPAPRPAAPPPAPRKLTVVHDGRAVGGGTCPHCGEVLVHADDRIDGYHTDRRACVDAARKGA